MHIEPKRWCQHHLDKRSANGFFKDEVRQVHTSVQRCSNEFNIIPFRWSEFVLVFDAGGNEGFDGSTSGLRII